MKIIYKPDSLMDAPERHMIHGCNAQGRMGSGVAALIRSRYPKAYEDYHHCYMDKGLSLGELIISINDPHVVINAITQEFFGYDGKLYLSYDALTTAFATLDDMAWAAEHDEEFASRLGGNITAVALPLIGCGLAGGQWSIVSNIIENTSQHYQPVVYLNGESIPVQ